MDSHIKILSGLERIAEVFKTMLWQKAKILGLSPIQIQILLFVSNHSIGLSNVSDLAKEFNITKPTVSDAVKSLISKGYLEKEFSHLDNRRFNLLLTPKGSKMILELKDYALPLSKEIADIDQDELNSFYKTLSSLIFNLNQKGIIQVQRTCFGCRFYSGDKSDEHYCMLLEKTLLSLEIRLDCPEYEKV